MNASRDLFELPGRLLAAGVTVAGLGLLYALPTEAGAAPPRTAVFLLSFTVCTAYMLLARGLISPHDLALFKITDSVDEAVQDILQFYRVYHSMRFVRDELVLRLQKPLSEALLERVQEGFADILVSGRFIQSEALPAESGDAHVAALPRLRFHFDRKNLGRLRMLIDTINREA